MENNKLIKYKENIFVKICNFFKNLFNKNKMNKKDEAIEENNEKNNKFDNEFNKDFQDSFKIKTDEEEIRLKKLQILYENNEIDEDDISDEDIDKLVEMYEKETQELNLDTERRKNHIAKMLKELKYN